MWWETTADGAKSNIKKSELYYEEAVKSYNKNAVDVDTKYFEHIEKQGTFADKTMLLSQQIQESPMHHLRHFHKLLEMAKTPNRDQASRTIETMVQLFATEGILPPRPLRVFHACLDRTPTIPQVVQAHFESGLRDCFFQMLVVIEEKLKDSIPQMKSRCLGYLRTLALNTVEHTENIVRLISHKLLDANAKVAATAGHHLINIKPKMIVIKYLCIATNKSNMVAFNYLSQIKLSEHDDKSMFELMLKSYSTQLDELVASRVPVEDDAFKCLGYVLSGLKRLQPYHACTVSMSTLHMIWKHSPSPFTCIQVIALLIQTSETPYDRLHASLKQYIFDHRFMHTRYLALFLETCLLYTSPSPRD